MIFDPFVLFREKHPRHCSGAAPKVRLSEQPLCDSCCQKIILSGDLRVFASCPAGLESDAHAEQRDEADDHDYDRGVAGDDSTGGGITAAVKERIHLG